jgi:ATP-binding protein involved in chromosome partitioning
MNMFICPKCGHEAHLFGHDGAQLMSLQYLVNFLGSLPLDPRIQQQDDSGIPFVALNPQDRISQIFRDIAKQMMEVVQQNEQDATPIVPQSEEQLTPPLKEIKWNI